MAFYLFTDSIIGFWAKIISDILSFLHCKGQKWRNTVCIKLHSQISDILIISVLSFV